MSDRNNAEFQFLDFARPSRKPRPAERFFSGTSGASEKKTFKSHAKDWSLLPFWIAFVAVAVVIATFKDTLLGVW